MIDTYTLDSYTFDTYAPPRAAAICPHCTARLPVVVLPTMVPLAYLHLACPACDGTWDELRQAGCPTARGWEPTAAACTATRSAIGGGHARAASRSTPARRSRGS